MNLTGSTSNHPDREQFRWRWNQNCASEFRFSWLYTESHTHLCATYWSSAAIRIPMTCAFLGQADITHRRAEVCLVSEVAVDLIFGKGSYPAKGGISRHLISCPWCRKYSLGQRSTTGTVYDTK